MRSKLSREQRVCQQSLFNQNFAILAEEDWSECLSSAGHAAELLQARRETPLATTRARARRSAL